MQTVTPSFTSRATADLRPLSWELRASFDKTFDDDIEFFTLDVSLLDGTDLLAPSDNNVISQWDKYAYADYSSRVISMEVTREEQDPYSTVLAHADVVLNNYDNYFTPNSGSAIDDLILPKRPFRLLMGFGGENLPQFVGLNEKMPEIDKVARTVSFHLIDFLSFLYEQDISSTVILENVRTHEVLDHLFQLMGLTPTQYQLDGSFNRIKFFFVDKGAKFGDIVHKLLEAEMGRLYMDEAGVIQFRNRYNFSQTPVYTFDKSNTIDYKSSTDSLIKNKVKVAASILGVQEAQSIWGLAEPQFIPAGGTLEISAEFVDPVTSSVDPVYSPFPTNDSYYTAAIDSAGNNPYTGVDFVSIDLNPKAATLTFQNTGGQDALITVIDLWGTPAKVIDGILIEEKDQASIDDFGEELHEIDNPYIQRETDAVSRALLILHDYAEQGSVVEIDVKGTMALQVSDPIDLDLDGYQGLHTIQRITNILGEGKFGQRLKVKSKVIVDLFILDVSLLDGTDVLAP